MRIFRWRDSAERYSPSSGTAAVKVVVRRTRGRKRAVQARLRNLDPFAWPSRRSFTGCPLRLSQGDTQTVSSATLPRSTRRRWGLMPTKAVGRCGGSGSVGGWRRRRRRTGCRMAGPRCGRRRRLPATDVEPPGRSLRRRSRVRTTLRPVQESSVALPVRLRAAVTSGLPPLQRSAYR